MILTGLAVFLFGTAVSAGPLVPHVKEPVEIIVNKHLSDDKVTEYYPITGGSPFISNYIQKGTNIFFKPQFLLSAERMPPQIQTLIAAIEKDDCKTTLPVGPIPALLEETLKVIQKEERESMKPVIKEVIEINPGKYYQHVQPTVELIPAELPSMPVLVDNKSTELGVPCVSEEDIVIVPEAPVLSPYVPSVEMPVSVVIESEKPKDIVTEVIHKAPVIDEIPPAPVLAPLEIPSLPISVEAPVKETVEVNIKPEKVPEITVVPSFIPEAYVREVVVSPSEAPVPRPLEISTEPIEENLVIKTVDIPAAPTLAPFDMPKLSVVVEEVPFSPEKEVHEVKIVDIPEAPVLSPYIPERPEIVVKQKPVVIPQPPELPPFSLPKLPLSVVMEEKLVVSPKEPELPCEEIKVVEEVRPLIPEAPVLAPFIPVNIPEPIVVEEPINVIAEKDISKPLVIPAAPVLPPFEMPKLPVMIEEKEDVIIVVPHLSNEEHVSPPIHTEVIISPPQVIPEAPVLPPLSIPELPLKVQVAENIVPCDTEELVEPLVIPEAPVLTPYIPVDVPTINVEGPVNVIAEKDISEPSVIPAAPVLPPFEMPKLPVVIEEKEDVIVVPYLPNEEHVSPPIHTEIIVSPPQVIPEAPVLPPLSLPELPLKIQVGEKVAPCDTVEVVEPLVIPEAPVLTPYIPVDVPTINVEGPVNVIAEKDISEPSVIPAAPVLPPFEMPKLPVVIEEKEDVIVVPYLPNEEHVSPPIHTEIIVSPPQAIPEAPVLPPLSLPELPLKIQVGEKVVPCDTVEVVEPLVIPEAPVLATYVPIENPTSVFDKEPIVVEIQKPIEIPPAPVLPPLELSKAPINIEEPCLTHNEPEHPKVDIESRPIVVMAVPYAFSEASLPNIRESTPILPSAPEFLAPYFPVVTENHTDKESTPCVHDVVVEHILPKSLSFRPAANAPVSQYLAPIRYAV